jgi:mono/diheme cytochrome c family protein
MRLVRTCVRGWVVPSLTAMAIGAGLVGWGAAPRAQGPAPDPADIEEGQTIYRTKADCQTCHGWAADGRKMDTQMPDAPSLRTTRLGRAGVIYAIRCGRPGRGMPAFDRMAYQDVARCNNTTKADLAKNNLALTDPASTLQPREIEMIADFLFAKVIGKGPLDYAKCLEYVGPEDKESCEEFK